MQAKYGATTQGVAVRGTTNAKKLKVNNVFAVRRAFCSAVCSMDAYEYQANTGRGRTVWTHLSVCVFVFHASGRRLELYFPEGGGAFFSVFFLDSNSKG